ncbi:MAG: hypothetical protein ACYTG7_14315 [Planctomycetota bacterium]|jgi:hypothetical protein
MRFWLIGCGVVLVILIGLAFFFGNIFFRQVEESKGKEKEASILYQRLERDFPFEKPWGRTLTGEDLEKFVACRRQVLESIEAQFRMLEDEEISIFEEFTRSMDMFPSLTQTHSQALEKLQMSPQAYYWIMNQVLLALRFAEAYEAPQELKSLRRLLNQSKRGQDDTLFETGPLGSVYSADTASITQWNLLPQIEPWQINMPPENIQAIVDHAQGLEETMEVFFLFDRGFKMICTQIFQDPGAAPIEGGRPLEEGVIEIPPEDK